MKTSEIRNNLEKRLYDNNLLHLYEDASLLDYQYSRYLKALEAFEGLYGTDHEVHMYSTSGRTEVCGNHTDHQRGNVVAASINLDAIAVVKKSERYIRVTSDGNTYPVIDTEDLSKKDEEEGTSVSIIKGVIARLKELGYHIGGFDAYVTSDVLIGSGMSSSACFEVLMGTIVSGLYNNNTIDTVTLAKVGQYAENVFFGKPCGLMDQCACAVGGLVTIDFKDTAHPIVEKVDVEFSEFNASLCIVDTKGSHADLTDEYAAVPREMKNAAHFFNKEVLREVDEDAFYDHINEIRAQYGDRSVLRAIHFFNEQKRVQQLLAACKAKNYEEFKSVIKASGDSSYKYLQNVYANSDFNNQSVSLALALSEKALKNHGVCRVHGGGFSGTIQAFVDDDYVAEYKKEIEKVFGEGSCHILKIRNIPTTEVF